MKKLILSLFLAFALLSHAFGKTVDENLARNVAAKYLVTHSIQSLPGSPAILSLSYSSLSTGNSMLKGSTMPLYYVFNINLSQGFIIISGDDIVYPILAYSSETSFNPNNIPPNVAAWLKVYEDQISFAISTQMQPIPEIQSEWSTLTDGPLPEHSLKSGQGVNPLMATLWDQSPLYNAQCPFDNTFNDRTVTGCVATAMAMVLKFFNFPPSGAGYHSYNTNRYGTLSANFGGTSYNWAAMPNTVSSANSAVATLMYHCGVSVDMDYNVGSQGGSSAYVISSASPVTNCTEYALKTYFGYASTLQGLKRANFTNPAWINLLKTELNASRPIIYAGFGTGGGHCFVCDGYNDNDYFHFNWGWSGNYDGYFLIDALNPGGTGTGGGTGSYNDGQQAVVGIHPPSTSGGGSKYFKLALNAPITCPSDTLYYEDSLSFHTDIINNGQVTFNGYISAGIFDTNDVFIDFVQTIKGITLEPGAHLPNGISFANTGLSAMLPGTYYIGVMYSAGDTNWKDVIDTNAFYNYKQVDVINPNDIEMYSAMNISPGTIITQGNAVSVGLDIYNYGITNFNGTLDLSIYDIDGEYANTIEEKTNFSLNANEHTNGLTFSTSSINVVPGTYLVALWYQPSGTTDWQLIGSTDYTNPVKIEVRATPLVADQYEPNNTLATSFHIKVGFDTNPVNVSTSGANCHVGTDYDFYNMTFPMGYTYVITGKLIDSESDTAQTYTLDGIWSYSIDGTNWSSTFDDTIPLNIIMNDGGNIQFYISPKFTGETGTYQATLRISRNPLGLNDELLADEIRVYPNPAIDYIRIETINHQPFISGCKLSSIDGREVMDVTLPDLQSNFKLPVARLNEGIYILHILTPSGIVHRQIIIRK
ncbi:MAG: C10 family peptidase [Bacteroidetes bacterium]|nr:C10 family peptidase [Bacteroidota bacterium]